MLNELETAETIYKKQIRRYLGLGFFLSFIPGTEIYLARENLLSIIEEAELENERREPVFSFIINSPLHVILYTIVTIGSSFRNGLTSTLKRNEDEQVNRLNPFLYITQLLVLILKEMPEIALFYVVLIPLLVVFTILQFVTELVLNSLFSLLIEPLIFGYEVIEQLVTEWPLEYASTPTEDYKKVNKLLNATNDPMYYNETYSTKELTLIEARKQSISSYKKHEEHAYFKLYKNTGLFDKRDSKIAEAYMFINGLFILFLGSKDPAEESKFLNKDAIEELFRVGLNFVTSDVKLDNDNDDNLLRFQ
jgi:hypothetical protein